MPVTPAYAAVTASQSGTGLVQVGASAADSDALSLQAMPEFMQSIGTFSPCRSAKRQKAASFSRSFRNRLAWRSTFGSVVSSASRPPAARLGNHLFRTLDYAGRVCGEIRVPSSFFIYHNMLRYRQGLAVFHSSASIALMRRAALSQSGSTILHQNKVWNTCWQDDSLQPLHYARALRPVATTPVNRRFTARARVQSDRRCSMAILSLGLRSGLQRTSSIARKIRASADRTPGLTSFHTRPRQGSSELMRSAAPVRKDGGGVLRLPIYKTKDCPCSTRS